MRTSYLRKESYDMHERSWDYNNHHPSYSYDHHLPIPPIDRGTHHDDGTLGWCGTIHANKTTTLLKKKDGDQGLVGSKPILRPPLIGYQPHRDNTTTYYGGGGGAYEYDKFIGDRPRQPLFQSGGAFEHDGFIDRPHQRQVGGAAYEYDGFIDRSHQHSLDRGHREGFGTWFTNMDGHDLAEKSRKLESLVKDMELNGGGRGGGVKVIELVQIERTRTYGNGYWKQWKTMYRPSNGHIFPMGY